MAGKKQTDKQRLDSVLASDPNRKKMSKEEEKLEELVERGMGITEAMMISGHDSIEIEDNEPVKRHGRGVGEENLDIGSGRSADTLRNAEEAHDAKSI